jgi:hypothetical protein
MMVPVSGRAADWAGAIRRAKNSSMIMLAAFWRMIGSLPADEMYFLVFILLIAFYQHMQWCIDLAK